MSTSLAILREQGAMSLRDLTQETSRKMGCRQLYRDVDAVMRRHEQESEASVTPASDYRDAIWSANP